MTPQINNVLSQIRRRLQEESDLAWSANLTGLERTNHSQGEPGDGGAVNETDIPDALDKYMAGIANNLVQNYGMGEDAAFAKIGSVARKLAGQGTLPALPSESADDADIALWLGKAASIGFAQHVFQAANDA